MTKSTSAISPLDVWPEQGRISRQRGGLGGFLTAVILGSVLLAGPLVLGSARLWYELPLLGGVALLLFIQGVRLSQKPARSEYRTVDSIDWAVVIFVLYAIGRWLTSPTEYFSRLEILNVIAYATIFLTCRHGMARRTYGLVLLGALVVLGVGETIFGYILSLHSDINDPASLWFPFGDTERLTLLYAPRWQGTYGCPDHYGCLLVMILGAALALGSFSKLSWPTRIVLFYLAALMAVGVIYSGSRGSWLGLVGSVFALTIFGVRHGTVRWWVPIIGSLVLLGLLTFLVAKTPRIWKRVEDTQYIVYGGGFDTYIRVQLAENALQIAKDYPIFGTGPATFVFVHPRYQSATLARKAIFTHDDYLNCLDDYGVIGFCIALYFVIAVTLTFLGGKLVDGRWQDRVLTASGFAAWSALLLHSTVDFNMHIPANALILFALAGLGLSRVREEETRKFPTVSLAPVGRWLGLAVVVVSLAYGLEVGRTAISDILYEAAFAKTLEVPISESIQGVNSALKIDPGNAQALGLLGDLYRFRASQKTDIEARVEEGQKGLDAYQRALKANPLDDTIQARLGMTFDIMRRYSEAFFCYQSATSEQPYNGQFWSALGNHFWQRGMLEKAEQAYLIGEKCPHGAEGCAEAVEELRPVLNARGVPPPDPGTNPFDSPAEATPPEDEVVQPVMPTPLPSVNNSEDMGTHEAQGSQGESQAAQPTATPADNDKLEGDKEEGPGTVP